MGLSEPNPELDALAQSVVSAAFEVHRFLGPGYLESVYEEALAVEFQARLDSWTYKGMCAVCGAWLYFHGDSGSETHCGKPLINVIARCPALEPTRRAAALPTGPAAVRKLARALLQLLRL